MISPAEIPRIPGDMDVLSGHAESLKSAGSAFSTTGASVHSNWQGLSAVYDAPEVGELLNATQPVSRISDTVGGNVEAVAHALSTYATTVKPIKERLETLRAQARTFVTSVGGDDEWRADEDKINEHNSLMSQVNEAVAEWMAAQRSCANAINATYGGTQYVADNGDGHRATNEFGYTRDQLNGVSAGEQGLPWGKAEEHDSGIIGDVTDFFVGLKDGAVNMVVDLGGLIGYANGEWSWSNAGTAWKGLGTFALALGTYSNPVTASMDQSGHIPFMEKRAMGSTLLTAGKSIIAYDQWGKGHNGRAAGEATFNVVSAVVGTKGAGGALRGTGAALQGTKSGAAVGGHLVRAGDFVAKMPTVNEIGIKAANKFNLHIPDIGSKLNDSATLGHRVDVDMPNTHGPDVPHPDTNGRLPADTPSVYDGVHPTPNTDGHRTEVPSTEGAHHLPDTSSPDAPVRHGVDGDAPVRHGIPDGEQGIHDGPVPGDDPVQNNAIPNDQAPNDGHHFDQGTDQFERIGEGTDQFNLREMGLTPEPDYAHLARPTEHVHQPAMHAGSVPPAEAQRFLNDVFPGTGHVNATRLHWGEPFQQNCTHCVVTMEARLNGADVSATPRPVLGQSNSDMLAALPRGDSYRMESYDNIVKFMRDAGEGSRGVVKIGRPDGTAHVFNVVNTEHGTVFLDGQTGGLANLEPDVSYIGFYHYK